MDKSEVLKIITNTEKELTDCFTMLTNIKIGNTDNAEQLLHFQPKLAECLYELMEDYRKLCEEERHLIKEKDCYQASEFSRMMNNFSNYKNAFKSLFEIGKALGDGFAWMFYQNGTEELEKHYLHTSNGLFPFGVGGRGEVEFIKSHHFIDGYFILYHSITDILRIGDFSLCTVDGSVVGVGELKSKKSDDTLQIDIIITSKVELKPDGIFRQSKEQSFKDPDRLRRQLREQEHFIRPNLYEIMKSNASVDNQYNLIERALASEKKMVISDDNSMVVVVVEEKGDLPTILLTESYLMDSFKDDIAASVQEINIDDSEFNNIHICNIDTKMTPFRKPIIWWDLNEEIIYQIIFKKLNVSTITNAGYFYSSLFDRGFSVQKSNSSDGLYAITYATDSANMKLEQINLIIDLIFHDFFRTESIVKIIDCLRVDTFKGQENRKITVRFNQRIGTYDDPNPS